METNSELDKAVYLGSLGYYNVAKLSNENLERVFKANSHWANSQAFIRFWINYLIDNQ